jgi:multiple sugar transport system substrate-binding protein
MKSVKEYINRFYISLIVITVVTIIAFILLFFTGVNFLNSDDSEKKIYFVDNISPGHKIVIDRFNELNRGNIKVIAINLPFEKFSTNERKELLIRYLRSKSDRIDIFSVDQIWTTRFAKFVEPLGSYYPTNKRDLYLNAAIESCYYNDQLVAIPLYLDISVMYYNIDEVKALPNYLEIIKELENFITWERFIEIGKKYKKNEKPYYIFPASNYEGLLCSYFELMEAQNKKVFFDDSVDLSNEESVKAVQLLVDLVHKYNLSPLEVTSFKETESDIEFISKKGMFLRNWPGFYKWYDTFIGVGNPKEKYGIAPLPYLNGSNPSSIIGGWNLMISAYSKNKGAAFEFIKYLNSDEAQSILYENSGYLPITKNFYDNTIMLNKYPQLIFYKNLFKSITHRPYLEKYTRYSDILSHYINLAIKNEISVFDALKKAESIINSDKIFFK